MNGLLPPSNMGVLRGEWRVHACELDDVALVQESLEWLSGIDDCVKWVEEKSFHGPLLITGIVKLERKNWLESVLRDLVERLFSSSFQMVCKGELMRIKICT